MAMKVLLVLMTTYILTCIEVTGKTTQGIIETVPWTAEHLQVTTESPPQTTTHRKSTIKSSPTPSSDILTTENELRETTVTKIAKDATTSPWITDTTTPPPPGPTTAVLTKEAPVSETTVSPTSEGTTRTQRNQTVTGAWSDETTTESAWSNETTSSSTDYPTTFSDEPTTGGNATVPGKLFGDAAGIAVATVVGGVCLCGMMYYIFISVTGRPPQCGVKDEPLLQQVCHDGGAARLRVDTDLELSTSNTYEEHRIPPNPS